MELLLMVVQEYCELLKMVNPLDLEFLEMILLLIFIMRME